MKIRYKKNDNLILPTKAHDSDAGWDIYSNSEPKIVGELKNTGHYYSRIDYIEYKTGLYINPVNFIPECNPPSANQILCRIDIKPRSSISKYNLVLANSVATIDQDYRGEILVRFKYIMQPEDIYMGHLKICCNINKDKIYKKGDKIAQLMFETVNEIEWIEVDELANTERGFGGFGSSGN